jgi:hypothetical protein
LLLTQKDAKIANEPANILNFVMTHRGQTNHFRVESGGSKTVTKLWTCFHFGRSADLPRAADIGARLWQGVMSSRAEREDKLKWREGGAYSTKCNEEGDV